MLRFPSKLVLTYGIFLRGPTVYVENTAAGGPSANVNVAVGRPRPPERLRARPQEAGGFSDHRFGSLHGDDGNGGNRR